MPTAYVGRRKLVLWLTECERKIKNNCLKFKRGGVKKSFYEYRSVRLSVVCGIDVI